MEWKQVSKFLDRGHNASRMWAKRALQEVTPMASPITNLALPIPRPYPPGAQILKDIYKRVSSSPP